MDTVVEINENNIEQAAGLSIELWPDSSHSEMTAHYAAVLTSSLATCFLLQDESGYFGFIELSTRNDYVEGAEDLPVAYIEGIYVNAEHRHRGRGSILLEHAEGWARSKGFKQLCSDTELENSTGIAFHSSSGFTEVSRNVCFVKDIN